MKRLAITSLFSFLCACICAQIVSPRINADKSVTFTCRFPDANEVFLKGEVLPVKYKIDTPVAPITMHQELKMELTADSVWTVTVEDLAPDFYMYYFKVEGVNANDRLDMANPLSVRDIKRKYSAFVLPGGTANNYLDNPSIPHGEIVSKWYPSSVANMPRRRMNVYLPHGYSTNKRTRYPVLYLFHGTGGDEEAWRECGRVVQILDNMIAKGEVEPLIVVLPNCNTDLDAAPGYSKIVGAAPSSNNTTSMFGRFEASFVGDIVHYTDSVFRTKADKAHRAVAGLSLGGMQTLFVTANNPDLCDYVGLFSAQIEPTFPEMTRRDMTNIAKAGVDVADAIDRAIPLLGNVLGKKARNLASSVTHLDTYKDIDKKLETLFDDPPQLFYIACGKDDFVKKMNDDFRKKLTSADYPYVYEESEGGHTWSNWRHYLMDFLPRLWKENR